MSVLSKPYFHDEKAAFAHLESLIWPNGPVCPHCGCMDSIGKIKANPAKRIRLGLHKCYDCNKQFTVKVGTVFEHMRIPLSKALQACYLMACSKKGVSSHQLHRILEVQYRTAWFLTHRIREAMRADRLPPLGGEGKIVEADETYIGNRKGSRRRNVFVTGKGWVQRGGNSEQRKIVSLVERGGRARSIHVQALTANQVRNVLVTNASRKSDLMTDESNVYPAVGREFASHDTVNHSVGEYGRGLIHTNTIEGFFSIFKRGMKGVYQHCGEQHLHRYLAEFDFRYSNRSALKIDDQMRAGNALKGIVGKRLTYGGSGSATEK
jgi:transposase-like protein